MAVSRSFEVPNSLPQDVAIIMGFVDLPESLPSFQETKRGHKRKGSPNIVSRSVGGTEDEDISSSCTESEEEVEVVIGASSMAGGGVTAKTISSSSEEEDSESESSSSTSSISNLSSRPRGKTSTKRHSPVIDCVDVEDEIDPVDGIEDFLTVDYIPTPNEVLPNAFSLRPLPDPSTLPQEALQLVGEIVTILEDSVTVRGSCLSSASARERRDAVLNEGSLLLFDDRTPLGYISDTFGPTTLPHYLVRVDRTALIGKTTSETHSSADDSTECVEDPTVSKSNNITQHETSLVSLSVPSPKHCHDSPNIVVSRQVYHIPSLSNFVFPNELAKVKGSDASNKHDEEVSDQEKDFSDDEAEKLHKRLRKLARSLPQKPLDDEYNDSISVAPDGASSLYGASPYDFEDRPPQLQEKDTVPASPTVSDSPTPSVSLMNFEDAGVQEALMLARNSRHRRHASVSISEVSSATGSIRSHGQDHQPNSRGRRGGRGRGKDRGRERNLRGSLRGHDHPRRAGGAHETRDGKRTRGGDMRSSYSFQEYDPHMPRLPSPTSMAIARATGQWADGTPFPYGAGATSGASVTETETHAAQASNSFQGGMSMNYYPEPYGNQGYYNPSVASPQILGHQPMQVGNYGVVPHVNPRFAQTFSLPNSMQGPSVTQQNGIRVPGDYPEREQLGHEAEPVVRLDD